MAKDALGIGMRSDSYRLTLPPEWALEVSKQGVRFLGPAGEVLTVSSSPLDLPSRLEPLVTGSEVSQTESREIDGTLTVEFVARGPRPQVTLRCTSPAGKTVALEGLAKSLDAVEWFPPRVRKAWWRFW